MSGARPRARGFWGEGNIAIAWTTAALVADPSVCSVRCYSGGSHPRFPRPARKVRRSSGGARHAALSLLQLQEDPRYGRVKGGPLLPGGTAGPRRQEGIRGRLFEKGRTGFLRPYEVLGVDRGQGFEEIRRRYKEKLLQYHPDRVLHLGREFQEMAERKTKEITEAFQKIQKERAPKS